MMTSGTFSTKDIELAAFLHASDIKIADIRRNDYGKTVFVFSDPEGSTKRLSLAFYNHEDQVSASKLLWSFNQVKSMVFDPNLDRGGQVRS
jgi:hypothetical protein